MKNIKLAVIALFTLVSTYSVNAQDSNNPWAISIGVNAVDVRDGGDFSGMLKDHLKTQDWNFLPTISRITAERFLEDGFTLQLAGSMNRVTNVTMEDDADLVFTSLDVNLKYGLDAFVAKIFGNSTRYFSPFVYLGGGYTALDGEGEWVLNYGFGINVWLSETVGLVYQSGTKQDFKGIVPAHYQHSLGIVVKFGGKD